MSRDLSSSESQFHFLLDKSGLTKNLLETAILR